MVKTPLVDSLLAAHGHVHVRNKTVVERKLKKMVKGGYNKLQVVTDFDSTLTKLRNRKGAFLDDSWGVLERSKHMPKTFLKTCQALRDKYSLIEQDPNLSVEEKTPHMLNWTKQSIECLIECKVTRDLVFKMASETNLQFRDGLHDLLHHLCGEGVPFLILSAGVGDLIQALLEQKKMTQHCNLKVVSNFFDFDAEGSITGIKGGNIIHVFNKNHGSIDDAPFLAELKERTNCILMGDMVGDLSMSKGLPKRSNVLTVGFLNIHVRKCKKQYLEKFDIVIVKDNSMTVPLQIIQKIEQQDE